MASETAARVAFVPDGRTVLIAASDGMSRRFDVDYHDTIRYLCNHLLRDFSDEEQTQYDINDSRLACS